MKSKSKLLAFAIAVAVLTVVCVGCGALGEDEAASDSSEYILMYEWPEKPRVGNYTLRVTLTDKAGAQVEGAEITVSYDMPSMRGYHATTETMKKNDRGDYLLPIHFAMPGDWEIIVSAYKDDVEIALGTLRLDI